MINKTMLDLIRNAVWLLDAAHTIIAVGCCTYIWRIVNILEIFLCRWSESGQQWGGEKEKEKETQEI